MAITKTKTTSILEIDISELELDAKERKKLAADVGDYMVNSILDYVGEAKTPVSGGKYKSKLSPEYAKEKGTTLANLDLNGDMLGALEFIPLQLTKDKIVLEIGIFDEDQAIKSYNHNKGDTLPQRQFIPDKGENFKRDILGGIKDILNDYKY